MTMTDTAPEQLTEAQWQIAHAIAQSLVKDDTDVNELSKAIAYLRSAINRNPSNAGVQFFKFLKTLVGSGNQIGHSSRTINYYRNIDKACLHHLKGQETNAQTILQILGWVARLMRYYKVAPVSEIAENATKSQEAPILSARQTAIAELKDNQIFEEGQIIEAQVDRKQSKGTKVTYLIAGISFTEKEPKTFDQIPDRGTVKVQIKSLKEDGSINHVKFINT